MTGGCTWKDKIINVTDLININWTTGELYFKIKGIDAKVDGLKFTQYDEKDPDSVDVSLNWLYDGDGPELNTTQWNDIFQMYVNIFRTEIDWDNRTFKNHSYGSECITPGMRF